MKKITYNFTCRLHTDTKVFGPGIAQLLHRVDELHSLRSAASSMNMAYSKAWHIIKSCEDGLGFKLLQSTTGGKNGGGAHLTDQARDLLTRYDTFCQKMQAYGDALFEEIFGE